MVIVASNGSRQLMLALRTILCPRFARGFAGIGVLLEFFRKREPTGFKLLQFALEFALSPRQLLQLLDALSAIEGGVAF